MPSSPTLVPCLPMDAAARRSLAGVILYGRPPFRLLVAPIVEETLFRGLLYPMLRKKTGAVVAAVLSSLLFAAMHGNAVQAVAVIPLGLMLALVAERTGRVWPCVVLHLAYNFAAMMLPHAAIQAMSTPLCIGLFGAAWAVLLVLLGRQVLSAEFTDRIGEPRARGATELLDGRAEGNPDVAQHGLVRRRGYLCPGDRGVPVTGGPDQDP